MMSIQKTKFATAGWLNELSSVHKRGVFLLVVLSVKGSFFLLGHLAGDTENQMDNFSKEKAVLVDM